ncbi:hypothetical protein N431DRAFT_455780 [Stipitochalara longipes BDJ]|nr:hypothetical protein N431DRAFT_455780 [Stipitochalara longipes BDJ]
MYTPISRLTFALLALPFASAAEDWWDPSSTTTTDHDYADSEILGNREGGWGPHGHHHPTSTTTATAWLPTTAWLSTTAWVPTTATSWIAPPAPSDSLWSGYTSYSLTTLTISFNTCPNSCFETTSLSTFSVPVTLPPTFLGAAPTLTSGTLSLPSTTNGWTLLPPTGLTTYGSGSVVTYVSGTSTSLSTIGTVSYTSYTSYSVETFISGTSTSLSTIGLPVATPFVVVGGAERAVQKGWNMGAAMIGAAGAAFAMM